jgi:GT2 family glycosyltransferase
MNEAGVVVIGRNEGERLRACIQSISELGYPTVYVDSGSTDGSPDYAKSKGIDVISLDMSIPFTAGRARNVGFEFLATTHNNLRYIQFVDGDSAVCDGWLRTAIDFLDTHPTYGIVSGHIDERKPQETLYNRLMAMEWNTPAGDATKCGGIFMVRVNHFQEVGGFNPQVIAGEEPELCVRLRRQGYRIRRLPNRMGIHDAEMTKFSQWWKRMKRCGYAYACGAFLHGKSPERHSVRECRSAIFWGAVIPSGIVLASLLTQGGGLLLGVIYPIQVLRVARNRRLRGESLGDAWLYGCFCVLAKSPEALGILKFHWERWMGKQARIIEYKGKEA